MSLFLLLFRLTLAQPHDVADTLLDPLDLASVKAGEWAESLLTREYRPKGGTSRTLRSRVRLACVKVEDDAVWIERTTSSAEKPEEKSVELFQIGKKDRRIRKAWSGKPGGTGREMRIVRRILPKAEKTTGTAKVVEEKLKIGESEWTCQRIDFEQVDRSQKEELKYRQGLWLSDRAPFPFRLDEAYLRARYGPLEWQGRPDGKRGIVKEVFEGSSYTNTTELQAIGTDAVPTLKTD